MEAVDVRKAAVNFIDEVAGAQERKKKTLSDTPEMQLFLLYIQANGHVPVHQAKGEITVQILVGDVRMSVNGSNHWMPVGHLLLVGSGVPHELWASENSVCLVTMAKVH